MVDVSDSPRWWHLRQAVAALDAGGLIAYPTEAVWGLGCDPWDEDAVDYLLQIKARPRHKGMILVAADVEQVMPWLDELDESLRKRALTYWPGPNTLLVPDPKGYAPEWIRGRHDSVAIRVSDHPGVQALCRAFGGPLVSTSCNPAGGQPARYPWQVARYFRDELDAQLPGPLGRSRRPSRIIDLRSGQLIRP